MVRNERKWLRFRSKKEDGGEINWKGFEKKRWGILVI